MYIQIQTYIHIHLPVIYTYIHWCRIDLYNNYSASLDQTYIHTHWCGVKIEAMINSHTHAYYIHACGVLAWAPSPSSFFLAFSLYWIRLLQFDAWSQVCVWEGLWLLLCLQLAYLPGQVEETLPYVVVVLGTRFKEQHVVELGISLWGGGRGEGNGTRE